MYNTNKCSPKLCKFSKPYYGTSTHEIGRTCIFDTGANIVSDGVECILFKKIENLNFQLGERFDRRKYETKRSNKGD